MSNLKEIEKTVEGKVWEDAIEKAYKKAIKKVKIDGFRPGKAPKNVFLKKYGETNLWIDAADIVLEDAYREVLEDALAQESRTGLNLFHPVRRMKTDDDLIIITRLEAL